MQRVITISFDINKEMYIYIILLVLCVAVVGLGYGGVTKINCPPVMECPKQTACPPCPQCPQMQCPKIECPMPKDPTEATKNENEHLRLLSKYLTILVRIKDAEEELYRTQSGRHRVYHSPRLVQLRKQMMIFKQKIQKDKTALQFFNDNLDLLM